MMPILFLTITMSLRNRPVLPNENTSLSANGKPFSIRIITLTNILSLKCCLLEDRKAVEEYYHLVLFIIYRSFNITQEEVSEHFVLF